MRFHQITHEFEGSLLDPLFKLNAMRMLKKSVSLRSSSKYPKADEGINFKGFGHVASGVV